jgi:DNA polymerase
MENIVLAHEVDWGGFRAATRRLIHAGIAPADVAWSVRYPDDLFAGAPEDASQAEASNAPGFALVRSVVELAQTLIQASDPGRFALLHALIHRAHAGERHILQNLADPDVAHANRLAQAVRRDTHRMRASIRFRALERDGATHGIAWFEPQHFVVEGNAGFFVHRFAPTTWSILTPYRSVHWNGADLHFGPGVDARDVPDHDALAEYWAAHFSPLFGPERLKLDAMQAGMPRKYWKNLPAAAAIPELVRAASDRADAMVNTQVNDPLRRAAMEAAGCQRCDLWKHATQTVFGEGPADAPMMLIGEQPGDQEDLAGRPFVGPAGQMLDRALAEAGIDRTRVYVTNAVKHFKFEPRGKRRIHQKPDTAEIVACQFWLDFERQTIRPRVTVLLGATAARGALGRAVAIGRERGKPLPLGDSLTLITVHPSYLLRLPDEAAKAREYAAFVADLRRAAEMLAA